MMSIDNPRQFLLDLYSSAISAVSAAKSLPQYLPKPVLGGRTIVIGAGREPPPWRRLLRITGKAILPDWS